MLELIYFYEMVDVIFGGVKKVELKFIVNKICFELNLYLVG